MARSKPWGFPCSLVGKESTCNSGDPGSIPGLGRFHCRRKCQSTPVFLPRKSHGQRSLVGYSPRGRKSQTQLREQTTTTNPGTTVSKENTRQHWSERKSRVASASRCCVAAEPVLVLEPRCLRRPRLRISRWRRRRWRRSPSRRKLPSWCH